MIKTITRLLGATATQAEITAAIDAANADLAAANAAVDAAEAAYHDGLLTESGAALRKLIDAKADATIDADRARAVIAKLEGDLETANASEAETGRQARYEAARDLAAKSRKALGDYEKAALQIRSILQAIAEADAAVDLANADLPEAAERLEKPEAVRSVPNLYRSVLSEEHVDLWVAVGQQGTPIPDHLQKRVQVDRVGRRIRSRYSDDDFDEGGAEYATVRTDDGGTLEVKRKRFLKRTILPDQSGYFARSLASAVELPALYDGQAPIWDASRDNVGDLNRHARRERPERLPEIEYSLAPKEQRDAAN